jgi:hypothetical protein
MIKKIHFILFSLLLSSGCVSTKNIPLDIKQIKSLNNKVAGETKRRKPSFVALTPTKAIFGVVGAGFALRAGNEIIRRNNIEDPAGYISKVLIQDFAKKYQLDITHSDVPLVGGESIAALSSQYSDSDIDILLDVKTINWQMLYFPFKQKKYRVIYTAKLRLIDVKAEKVIAASFCAVIPNDKEKAFSYNRLLDNNAEQVKVALKEHANFCIEEFRQKALLL